MSSDPALSKDFANWKPCISIMCMHHCMCHMHTPCCMYVCMYALVCIYVCTPWMLSTPHVCACSENEIDDEPIYDIPSREEQIEEEIYGDLMSIRRKQVQVQANAHGPRGWAQSGSVAMASTHLVLLTQTSCLLTCDPELPNLELIPGPILVEESWKIICNQLTTRLLKTS